MLSQNKVMRALQAKATPISSASQMRAKTHRPLDTESVVNHPNPCHCKRTRNILKSAQLYFLEYKRKERPLHNRTLGPVVTYNKNTHPDLPKKFENYANHIPGQNQHCGSQPDLWSGRTAQWSFLFQQKQWLVSGHKIQAWTQPKPGLLSGKIAQRSFTSQQRTLHCFTLKKKRLNCSW